VNLNPTELALVNRWQRNFPFTAQPFAVAGRPIGLDEASTIGIFGRLRDGGVISRIGAVVKPHTIGASTLAAMRVPPARLEDVATVVSEEALVSHNYEREHALNLWFVIAGPNADSIAATIRRIERHTGLAVLDLPLVKAYHLDLGFALDGVRAARRHTSTSCADYQPDLRDRAILAAIEDGLPLVGRPYLEVGRKIGCAEHEIISRLAHLTDAGVISRFGCVVRHRALGYTANAMAVWDIPADQIDGVAARFLDNPQVTLCYRRPRRMPDWPYNLFCMVHAKTRAEARAVIDDLNRSGGTGERDQTVLFSSRCFKQRGAVFSNHKAGVH